MNKRESLLQHWLLTLVIINITEHRNVSQPPLLSKNIIVERWLSAHTTVCCSKCLGDLLWFLWYRHRQRLETNIPPPPACVWATVWCLAPSLHDTMPLDTGQTNFPSRLTSLTSFIIFALCCVGKEAGKETFNSLLRRTRVSSWKLCPH